MNGWLTQLLGEQGATWTLYILGGVAILVLAWVMWFWTRRVAGGVFVEGGRNRRHRLAVVDATAVDSNRRIVLVRRDDVEHLVMIGGQNDFVIESSIESVPGETAQRGQPRDRRAREAQQPAAQGRRPLRREPAPAPAKQSVRDEAPRPPAPVSAPTSPPQPARETAPPEAPGAAAPVAAAAVAATPAFLRRVPEPAPAAPQADRVAPVMEPLAEPARQETPEIPEPVRYSEEIPAEPPRAEPFADRDEPLVQAPEPPQRQAEPEIFAVTEEAPAPAAVDMPETPQPEEPVMAEAAPEQLEPAEQKEVVEEEAFTALFARGQGNGSTFAERFMFQTAKPAEEPVVEPAPEPVAPEPETYEMTAEEPSEPLIEQPVAEEPQVEETAEEVVETAPEEETEAVAEIETAETAPEPVEITGGETEAETKAKQAPDNDDSERPVESLEDEMHRLLAQLTTGNR